MSNEAINAVLAAEIRPPALKLLALCMANYANKDTGLMWPGVGTLASDCSMSRTHVKRLLRELADQGVIVLVKGTAGGAESNVYRLNPERLGTGYTRVPGTTEFDHPEHWRFGTRSTDVPAPGTPVDPEPYGNPKGTRREPSRGGRGRRPPAAAGAAQPPGDPAWWARLEQQRADFSRLRDTWHRQAHEHYPHGGEALRAALELLIDNRHWFNLKAPGRTTTSRITRGSTSGYDYTKPLT